MKNKNLLMAVLLAASMTACINDSDVDVSNTPNTPVVDSRANATFTFVVPNTSTASRDAEDSGVHFVGSADEYAVKKVRLYLFSNTTGNFYKSVDVEGISAANVNGNSVTYTCNSIVLDPGTYRIFAIANAENSIASPATIDDLLNTIDNRTYTSSQVIDEKLRSDGLIMTNRGAQSQVATITADNHTNITITLERVVAKILLSTSENNYELKDNNGSTYVTISPAAYTLVNLSKEYYLFRHVATLPNASETPSIITSWDLDTNFGTIPDADGYAIDPHFFEKTVAGAAGFNGSFYNNPLANSANLNYSGTFGSQSSVYCLENCMFRPAQLQAYATGVLIKCNISIPENHCFDENGQTVAASFQPSTMYYFNYNFYTTLTAVNKIGKANIPSSANPTDEELAEYNIKRFIKSEGSHNCFYNYWIKHLDNGMPTYMGVMEYAIVRNNIYDITITNIAGLGDGTPNTDPEIPVEKKGYLDVDFDVMPWIVRSQNAELE